MRGKEWKDVFQDVVLHRFIASSETVAHCPKPDPPTPNFKRFAAFALAVRLSKRFKTSMFPFARVLSMMFFVRPWLNIA